VAERPVPQGSFAVLGDGRRMHYHQAGQGKVVVFMHGSGPGASGYSNFKGNFPYFAERGLRALVPDSLGFGYSDKPEDVDYTLDLHVGAYRQLLDALAIDRVSLVGNSHGGAIAIAFALAHPERVDRLVLMAPGGLEERATYMEMPGIKAMMKSVFGREGITRDGMRSIFELQLYDRTLITDTILDERYDIAKDQPKRVMSTQQVPNLAPRLKDLSCPVFGLWGMNDQFCPPSGAHTLAAQCRSARVMLLTGCGHWVMVEHRELFNRLSVDFLTEARDGTVGHRT
jgi:4,5:9,10-diseco-3-hydroxy-5,9,17-trioxoandrosta-1(10),2-diene-4-oate hydrolase